MRPEGPYEDVGIIGVTLGIPVLTLRNAYVFLGFKVGMVEKVEATLGYREPN